MESLAIADAQIRVSSEYNASFAAFLVRLYYKEGWVAATNDENQSLEVDMESQLTRVTRISTQGAHGDGSAPGWVTSYQLQFSSDGVSFQNYIERENANSNQLILSCRKDAWKNTAFSRLKYQLKRKKIDTACF